MSLKNTKIVIPEIPKERTKRIRAGHTNIWEKEVIDGVEYAEIELEPPKHGLYAERFDDGWYWVCGCNKCLGENESYRYVVCDEHNRCDTCGTHRNDLTEIPWGTTTGFQCKPCADKEHEEQKQKAIQNARLHNHSELDCMYTSSIICPLCGSENEPPEDMTHDTIQMTCEVCDVPFNVDVEYQPRYTSTML